MRCCETSTCFKKTVIDNILLISRDVAVENPMLGSVALYQQMFTWMNYYNIYVCLFMSTAMSLPVESSCSRCGMWGPSRGKQMSICDSALNH